MRGNFLHSFNFWNHTNVLQIKNNINSTRIKRKKKLKWKTLRETNTISKVYPNYSEGWGRKF